MIDQMVYDEYVDGYWRVAPWARRSGVWCLFWFAPAEPATGLYRAADPTEPGAFQAFLVGDLDDDDRVQL